MTDNKEDLERMIRAQIMAAFISNPNVIKSDVFVLEDEQSETLWTDIAAMTNVATAHCMNLGKVDMLTIGAEYGLFNYDPDTEEEIPREKVF